VHPHSDDELRPAPAGVAARRQLEVQRTRCLKAAKASFVGCAAGVVFLCAWGLKSAGVAVTVFFAVISLMFTAASAALFARVARLQLASADGDANEDDDGGWGRGPDEPSRPHDGGGLQFDWERFERDFRAYCERVPALN
jgi:hypothetical protein